MLPGCLARACLFLEGNKKGAAFTTPLCSNDYVNNCYRFFGYQLLEDRKNEKIKRVYRKNETGVIRHFSYCKPYASLFGCPFLL